MTQLAIPFPVQRRNRRRESPALYADVIALRKAGHRVYRAGSNYLVDGRTVTAQWLRSVARSIEQRTAER